MGREIESRQGGSLKKPTYFADIWRKNDPFSQNLAIFRVIKSNFLPFFSKIFCYHNIGTSTN
jgi:hypothetical protein